MKHNFEIAIEILNLILNDKVPFNLATKNTFEQQKIALENQASITGIIGCELRHHLLFEALVKEEFSDKEDLKPCSIYLALANHFFFLKFDEKEVIEITSKETGIDQKDINAFLAKFVDRNNLIPEKYQKGTFEYLSLRYNCPIWLVKMLNKHFGRGLAFKILQINTKPVIQSYKLNDIEQGKVLLDPNFQAAPIDDMVLYIGKGTAKNTEFYKNKQIIPLKMAYKEAVDKVDIKPLSNIAFYSGYSNTCYIDVAKRMKQGHMDLICSDILTHSEAKRHCSIYGLKGVSLYEEKAANLLAVISEKVDYFFMLARNSNFELLRSNADYFLRFNNHDLDSIMNEQRYSLEEASSLINVNGQLIYMIPTLNKKESKQIITEFLLIHKEFSLLEEKQYFPFEELNSTLYVARLMKMK